jgi:23S rRNA G2069 N7-methylase RlmK/C1962 C5-methylase RlmI
LGHIASLAAAARQATQKTALPARFGNYTGFFQHQRDNREKEKTGFCDKERLNRRIIYWKS